MWQKWTLSNYYHYWLHSAVTGSCEDTLMHWLKQTDRMFGRLTYWQCRRLNSVATRRLLELLQSADDRRVRGAVAASVRHSSTYRRLTASTNSQLRICTPIQLSLVTSNNTQQLMLCIHLFICGGQVKSKSFAWTPDKSFWIDRLHKKHIHHFNRHFPGKPGLAVCTLK